MHRPSPRPTPLAAKNIDQDGDRSRLTLSNGTLSKSSQDEELTVTSAKSNFTSLAGLDNRPAIPFVMGFATGTAFLTVLAGVSTVIVGLWVLIQHRNGLDVPSESPVVTQLVLNYLPILFATLLEPFRILLNKELCLFKPFETLLGGEAKAAQAMNFRYTSLPQIDHMASSRSPSRDSGHYLCHGVVNRYLSGRFERSVAATTHAHSVK